MRGLVLLLAFWLVTAGELAAQMRSWTDVSGRQMRAELVKLKDGEAHFLLSNGKRAEVEVKKLSAADQKYLETAGGVKGGDVFQMSSVRWPTVVDLPPNTTIPQGVAADPKRRRWVYRTANFEFQVDAPLAASVMKDVAQAFEATYELLQLLPWSVEERREGEYYRCELYARFRDYVAAGGPSNSGGVYKTSEHKFMVPFGSLGLKQKNGRFYKGDGFDVSTLVHEVTHMMMHEQLPFLPIWVIEGLAEYTSSMPYSPGRFRCDAMKRGVREYLERATGGRQLSVDDLKGVLRITGENWQRRSQVPAEQHRLYLASFVFVYYFMELEGDGNGEGMLRFLHAAAQESRRWRDYDRAFAAYEDAWAKFSLLPGVEKGADGSINYPDEMVPPVPPVPPVAGGYSRKVRYMDFKLLSGGKSEEEVLEDLREKFSEQLRIRFK